MSDKKEVEKKDVEKKDAVKDTAEVTETQPPKLTKEVLDQYRKKGWDMVQTARHKKFVFDQLWHAHTTAPSSSPLITPLIVDFWMCTLDVKLLYAVLIQKLKEKGKWDELFALARKAGGLPEPKGNPEVFFKKQLKGGAITLNQVITVVNGPD